MKKLLSLLTCLVAGVGLYAQTYYNYFTNLNNVVGSLTQVNYNNYISNPEALLSRERGFTQLRFDESTGNIAYTLCFDPTITSYTFSPKFSTPISSTANVVWGIDRYNIFYAKINPVNGSIYYSKMIPRDYIGIPNISDMAGLNPIDAVYDGSQYLYIVFDYSSLNGNGFLHTRMDVNTGVFSNTYEYYPNSLYDFPTINDIEYIDNSHIYISGVFNYQGAPQYFIAKLNPVISRIYGMPLSTNSFIPKKILMRKNTGYSIYLVGDTYDASNTSLAGPMMISQVTDNNNNTYTINNQTFYINPNMRLSQIDKNANNLLISGSAKSGSLPELPMNAYYDIGNSSLSVTTYSGMSSNLNLMSCYSVSSQRFFSAAKDAQNLNLYSLRTNINNGTTICNSTAYSPKSTPVSVTGTIYTFGGKSIVLSPVDFGLTAKCPAWTKFPMCSQNQRNTDQNASQKVNLFPNPACSILNVSSNTTVESYSIYDVAGRQVLSSQLAQPAEQVSIDINAIPVGIYFIVLNGDGISTRMKFNKQ